MATKIDNIPLTDIVLNRAWGGGGSNAKQLGGIPISFQCERGNKSFVGDNISFGDSESVGGWYLYAFDGKMVIATLQRTGITGTAKVMTIKNGKLCDDLLKKYINEPEFEKIVVQN